MSHQFALSDFDYALPPELIAQHPLAVRSASRLLDAREAPVHDRIFSELPGLLQPGDLLVFNDTRVINARLAAIKLSGGALEVMVERLLSPTRALVQLRASHAPKPGSEIVIAPQSHRAFATIEARDDRFFTISLKQEAPNFETLMRSAGELPLPPYMQRHAEKADETRYQTVYAKHEGAVAAPTAGLHFDEPTLAACRERGVEFAYVTLHVGAGTFLPVKTENLADHRMHKERYALPQSSVDAIKATKARGGRVIAVGTTSVRTLEGCYQACGELRAHESETEIFITPGFDFKVVDLMITNFHLPKSTLMMMVSAFAGYEHIRSIYKHAVEQRYRFFSYGDAMLLQRRM
ncbi:MAG: tRNA preQ1(34) S-adenosylmethionine ribosyltransferase-isomerase QueA [Burkholderiales bacterium]|nr:MAG: tRNA preQ1(34) S-adenosylmethionine ribosyltransferase-isomerase QueA [Burkholderiales bacterium]TAG82340.1 MAG: tRNA preQ1(34) S-adenosylmethionine ribosyltransferase-isomerase QueA [Betaproteobacteria bacterium]